MFNCKSVLVSTIVILNIASVSFAKERSSTGIGFRAGFWNMGSNSKFLTYINDNGQEYVETGGVGGWLTFVSRTSDYMTFELNLGGFGKVLTENMHFIDEEVDVTAVVPILLGIQREFLHVSNNSDLRPYLSFGGGPYWITNVIEDESADREEVITSVEPGLYFGGGLNFFLSPQFAITFDGKYHLVDFETEHEISGLEVGLGITVMWGKYKKEE